MAPSKKELLGKGSSFNKPQPMSSRRAAINASTDAPTEGAPPPVELPVGDISLNPANPRSELGDLSDLAASLKDHGQKAAISIMTRFSYLEANPGQEQGLEPGAKYVAIDGNSRLSAAREAGLPTIKVMLDDDLGADPDSLLESALVANVHRKALEPLDEAHALEQLLKVHGTQMALAERLHRSQGWVSQRLALLGLSDDLKERLVQKQESPALLRRIGKKKKEDQEEELKRLKEKEAQRQFKQAPPQGSTSMSGSHAASSAGPQTDGQSSDQDAASGPPATVPPQQRTPSSGPSTEDEASPTTQRPPGDRESVPSPTLDAVAWQDPAAVRDIIMEYMAPDARAQLVKRLLADMDEQHA